MLYFDPPPRVNQEDCKERRNTEMVSAMLKYSQGCVTTIQSYKYQGVLIARR